MTTVADIRDNDLLVQLTDPDQIIWTDAILFKVITEAQNACILVGADANIVTEDFTLAQAARQTLPSGGVRFVDVEGNVGGGSVTRVSKRVMDEVWPDWTTEESATAIKHFLYDEEQPAAFWVYPVPSVGTIHVNLSYAKAVPIITSEDNAIVLSDLYLPSIKEYALWRCLSMEGPAMAVGLAAQHLQNFYAFLGQKFQGEQILKAIQKNG